MLEIDSCRKITFIVRVRVRVNPLMSSSSNSSRTAFLSCERDRTVLRLWGFVFGPGGSAVWPQCWLCAECAVGHVGCCVGGGYPMEVSKSSPFGIRTYQSRSACMLQHATALLELWTEQNSSVYVRAICVRNRFLSENYFFSSTQQSIYTCMLQHATALLELWTGHNSSIRVKG